MSTPKSPGDTAEGGSSPGAIDSWVQVLEDVATLLHQAALGAWASADREGITSGLHHFALGAYLALGNTVALLPSAHEMSLDYPPIDPPAESRPERLVRAAEARLRAIAPGTVPGVSALVVEVCDLGRECPDDDS